MSNDDIFGPFDLKAMQDAHGPGIIEPTEQDEPELEQWQVTLTNTFEATSARDAIGQMATYCVDYAFQAGYRVDRLKDDGTVGTSEFIDAERFDFNEPSDD